MESGAQVLAVNDDLPVRSREPVHSGKVRAVYWLTAEDSARLIAERAYAVSADAQLGIMVISDRLSAFDCLWRAEGGLVGVPGKGAALNAIAAHWFQRFAAAGLARSHLLETPHPLLWVVQRARPLAIEAIARRYLTGSLARAYAAGDREFCGIRLPDGLVAEQRLPELLVTPSTKGVLRGLAGVPEADDVNVSAAQLRRHQSAFGFRRAADLARYERLLREGFALIEAELASLDLLFVDTKFEFGYGDNRAGEGELLYLDEVGTPDSSRIWDGVAYRRGRVVEFSKERFRQSLLAAVPDPTVLLNQGRMGERRRLARDWVVPRPVFDALAESYADLARRLTGRPPGAVGQPREELCAVLGDELGVLDTARC